MAAPVSLEPEAWERDSVSDHMVTVAPILTKTTLRARGYDWSHSSSAIEGTDGPSTVTWLAQGKSG